MGFLTQDHRIFCPTAGMLLVLESPWFWKGFEPVSAAWSLTFAALGLQLGLFGRRRHGCSWHYACRVSRRVEHEPRFWLEDTHMMIWLPPIFLPGLSVSFPKYSFNNAVRTQIHDFYFDDLDFLKVYPMISISSWLSGSFPCSFVSLCSCTTMPTWAGFLLFLFHLLKCYPVWAMTSLSSLLGVNTQFGVFPPLRNIHMLLKFTLIFSVVLLSICSYDNAFSK